MEYVGTVIRPPSEADSILLQVAYGCPHNACSFCGAYLDKPYRARPEAEIIRDLDFAATYCRRQRRLFLCDGDAMSLSFGRLLRLLAAIRDKLPWVTRVSTYARAASLHRKTAQELATLRQAGLAQVHMGLESGDEATLTAVTKGETVAEIVSAGQKAKAAGLKVAVTVLLGLAGKGRSETHARATGEALTAMAPDMAAALTLMLIPGTPLHAEAAAGRFAPLTAPELLAELRTLLARTELDRGLFFANHASNYLPIKLRLPRDKAAGLALIEAALAGEVGLRPEASRRL